MLQKLAYRMSVNPDLLPSGEYNKVNEGYQFSHLSLTIQQPNDQLMTLFTR